MTKLSPVRAHNGHGLGRGVSLRCCAGEEYDSCGKKQESPVQISSRQPTELARSGESRLEGCSGGGEGHRCCSKRSAGAATADGTKESSNKCYNCQSLVRGRGHGCVSRHKFLDVPGCFARSSLSGRKSSSPCCRFKV